MKILPLCLIVIALSLAAPLKAQDSQGPYEPLTPGAKGQDGRRTPIVLAIEKARPAVVSVYVKVITQADGFPFRRSPFHDEFFNRFFGDVWKPRARQNTSLGSGVIIDGKQGLVVTNEHVVRGANEILITLNDGRELPAEVLGADPRYDLALLKLASTKDLPELSLGDSEQLMIGETVIAIGNPFGFSHTATTGVVSATGRSLSSDQGPSYHDLIQTDASINPGNSGGPLLNVNGEVIGINTAILAQGEGLGFAIPSGQVKRISARLMRGEGQNISALDFGLKLAEAGRPQRGKTGCLVIEVTPGGPADEEGIVKGDVLMKLDGSPTSTLADYEMIVSSLAPKQKVKAEILRDDKEKTITLVPQTITQKEALDLAWDIYGLKVQEDSRGFLVLQEPARRSPAELLGLRQGDLLLNLGGQNLQTEKQLADVILRTRFQNSVSLAVKRGRTVYRTTLSR